MIDELKELNNVFFVEFKIQQTDGMKYKFKSLDEFENDDFKVYRYFDDKIDYCKFDFVILLDGKYIELSSIYVFKQKPFDPHELMKSLLDDRKELMKEGKFYKSIKRLFAYIKLQPENEMDTETLVNITRFFNSYIGNLYQKNSVLKAIKLMMETYPDNAEIDKYNKYVFNNMGFSNIENIDKIINSYDNLINNEGHKFIKMYLDKYNSLIGGWKQTGTNEFTSNTLPQLMGKGIFDSAKGMSPWESLKYGFMLPFQAIKKVNDIIPISKIFGKGFNRILPMSITNPWDIYANYYEEHFDIGRRGT